MQSYFWRQNFNSTSVEPHAKSEQHTTILRKVETQKQVSSLPRDKWSLLSYAFPQSKEVRRCQE